ncbi:MAG TPA: hypothetical protein VFW13_00030 [Phenylobacterium sp.]|nr:hypothetical protein [Phenylobacterium sp.]
MRIRAALVATIALAAASGSAQAEDTTRDRVHATMDTVFGAQNWRETGGYRTPERENELRAQGALTVPPGVLSHHSMGKPGDAGAYDLVVNGLSPTEAAERLRRAGAPFKLLAEGAHGGQGAHLHLEIPTDAQRAARRPPGREWVVADPTPAQLAVTKLRREAEQGRADAQLRLGQVYAEGRSAPKDPVGAYVWTALAASNAAADPVTRGDAERALATLTRTMRPQDIAQARRFVASPGASTADCEATPVGGPVLLVGPRGPEAPCVGSGAGSPRVTAG